MSEPVVELWLAYHSDHSDYAVFTSELEALRFAVDNSMLVQRIDPGESIRDQLRRR